MEFDTVEMIRERHPAWRLHRAQNALLVLSFLGGHFVEGNRGATGPAATPCEPSTCSHNRNINYAGALTHRAARALSERRNAGQNAQS